jgi:cytochrome c-type biogenesis protein CcmH
METERVRSAEWGMRNMLGGSRGAHANPQALFRIPHSAFRIIWVLVVLLGLLAFPTLARADALDDQVREIAKGLRCPVCSGETVADSHAPISVQMRGIIREKLEAGESKDQIDAYFVSRYGPEILLTPQASGFTLGVWVMPIVALVVGFLIVLAVLRSWSRRGDASTTTAEDVAPEPVETIPAGDDARLEQELARFRHGPKAGGGVPG